MKLRIMQIIKYLLDQNEFVTIDNIAHSLSVSNKTIRNDFKTVEQLLKDNHLQLVKKTGVGVYIEGESKEKLAMISSMKNYSVENRKYSSNDRQLYILFQLLNENKNLTIGGFEEELFISRPSVYKDLEKVRKWLSDRDIQMVHEARHGIYINAGEKRIRKGLFDLFMTCVEHDEIIELLEVGYYNFFSYEQSEALFNIDNNRVRDMISSYEEALGIIFTENGLKRLTTKFCIAINRMMDGHDVTMTPSTMSRLKGLDKYGVMCQMTEEISEAFEIEFSEEEICYFFGITLGTKTHYDQKNASTDHELMTIIKIIAKEMVEGTKKHFHIEEDEAFYNGLLHHLKAVSNKIRYGLYFQNDFLQDIKVGYPDSFEIAMKSKRLFEDYYNFDLPMEEVGFIALHIASAIERSKRPLDVCVVYSKSYSETKLLMEYLHNRYRQLNLKNVIPKSLYGQTDLSSYDLIIATESLEGIDKEKMVILPSILINKNLSNFAEIISEKYESHNMKRLRKEEKKI